MRLEQWYAEYIADSDCWIVHGSVYGNPKFDDGTAIHTSRVMSLQMSGGVILLNTQNSVYELKDPCIFSGIKAFRRFISCFEDERTSPQTMEFLNSLQGKMSEHMTEMEGLAETRFIYAYMQNYIKGDRENNCRILQELSAEAEEIQPETLMLAVKYSGSKFLFGVYKDAEGTLRNVVRYVHSGMFQDSVLLFCEDGPNEIIARYFPKGDTIEFYNQLYAMQDENPPRIVVFNTDCREMNVRFIGLPPIRCEGHGAAVNFTGSGNTLQ